jgi:hypothetical protein
MARTFAASGGLLIDPPAQIPFLECLVAASLRVSWRIDQKPAGGGKCPGH